jgi:hypothetical protein
VLLELHWKCFCGDRIPGISESSNAKGPSSKALCSVRSKNIQHDECDV